MNLPNEIIELILCYIGDLNLSVSLKMDNCSKKIYNPNIHTINNYASTGNLNVIKWLYKFNLYKNENNKYAMNCAIKSGHFDILKWLYKNNINCCTKYSLGIACSKGYFDMVKWIHKNIYNDFYYLSSCAMDLAAINGHLEILIYLHENNIGICSKDAMDLASLNGHFDIVKWLYKNRNEGYSDVAIKWALQNHHVEIVEFYNNIKNYLKPFRA